MVINMNTWTILFIKDIMEELLSEPLTQKAEGSEWDISSNHGGIAWF